MASIEYEPPIDESQFSDIPQSAVTNLTTDLAAKADKANSLNLAFWGLQAANMTPNVPAAGVLLASEGVAYVQKLLIVKSTTVTNIVVGVHTAGSGLDTNACFAALYDNDGNLLGKTADQSIAWQSTGAKIMPIAGGPFVLPIGNVFISMWANNTAGAQPTMMRGSQFSDASFINMNKIDATTIGASGSDNVGNWTTDGTGLTSTAPASLGTLTFGVRAFFAALS